MGEKTHEPLEGNDWRIELDLHEVVVDFRQHVLDQFLEDLLID